MRPSEALVFIVCAALAEVLALIFCAAVVVGCSSQSQNTKPVAVAQVPAAQAPIAAGAPATTVATVAGTVSTTAAPTGSDVDPSLAKEGYRAVRRQGKLLYCQTQTVTGTKFGNTVCRTAEQIQEEKRDTELSQRMLIRSGPANCVGTQCSK
jgi:hypothetical protein